MHNLILFLGICSAFALGRKLPDPKEQSEKIVGCYTSGGDLADLELLCTHVFYSYVEIGKDASIQIIDTDEDIEGQGYIDFNGLRKKNPKLKTLISIKNSDNHLSSNISENHSSSNITNNYSPYTVLTDLTLREKLATNIFHFVKKYEFSGIDLDLSDTSQRGEDPSNKENLVLSLKALKEKFDKEGLILSVTVDPNETTTERFYDVKGISTYVNFINLKTFNFHGVSDADKKVGHASPMYYSSKENAGDRKKNIDYVVKYWISQLALPNKLILGTVPYGTSYTLANPKQIGRGALFSDVGSYATSIEGTLEYFNICILLKKPEWKRFSDKEQQVPYIYYGNEIVAYENVESIKTKAAYAEKMKLGGVWIYSVHQDDFCGVCGEKYPLLKTLNQVLRKEY